MLRAETDTAPSPPLHLRTGHLPHGPARSAAVRPAAGADLDDSTVTGLAARVRAGDRAAYSELARRAGPRLGQLVRRLLASYPAVGRHEQADDVLQNVHLRLWAALRADAPASGRSLLNLAAGLARRELTDLARRYGSRMTGS